MGDVRQHEAPLDDGRLTLAQDVARPAGFDRRDAVRGIECSLDQRINFRRRKIALRANLKYKVERIGGALGLPEMIGHDTHRIVARQMLHAGILRAGILIGDGDGGQSHHGTHARHLQDVGFVAHFRHGAGEARH